MTPFTEHRTSSNQRSLLRIAKTFTFTLAIVVSGKILQGYLKHRYVSSELNGQLSCSRSRRGSVNNRNFEERRKVLDRSSVEIAAFPALLPDLYKILRTLSQDSPVIPEVLASPSLLLIPASWRKQLILYASSTAILHSFRKSGLNKHAPHLWTVYVLGNAWLLWTFVFHSEAFPKAYTKVIISNSTHYVPQRMTNRQISDVLTTPSRIIRSDNGAVYHHNSQCATLHPNEPSCLKNCIRSCSYGSARIGRWIGAVIALSLIITHKKRARLRAAPLSVFKEWLISSTRGTAFIAGSITSAWALNCASQRVSFADKFPHLRWLWIGSTASLWILALPRKRRDEVAFYVARQAALSTWNTWRLQGGGYIPYGDVILFGLSWAQLFSLRKSGEEITGVVGIALRAVEQA
ncbi:hypothetical protein SCHPADRAFT_839284 [Schizopora paradoxa]|uniref:Transmembrane protein 135 N-terminal domain-containing protein n=1 Tax=Schizopora paradoxa TaxID=27342 RepID=A0A0H2R2E5_9AGAM|nr:hypothetical protein SCHPADRAFT_839284 [Schizopora paradoxa]